MLWQSWNGARISCQRRYLQSKRQQQTSIASLEAKTSLLQQLIVSRLPGRTPPVAEPPIAVDRTNTTALETVAQESQRLESAFGQLTCDESLFPEPDRAAIESAITRTADVQRSVTSILSASATSRPPTEKGTKKRPRTES